MNYFYCLSDEIFNVTSLLYEYFQDFFPKGAVRKFAYNPFTPVKNIFMAYPVVLGVCKKCRGHSNKYMCCFDMNFRY